PVGFIPTQTQDRAGPADRTLQHHINGQPFHEPAEPAVFLRPGHGHRLATMLGATHHRHAGDDDRLELATVQMPPAPLFIVVNLHALLTLRTSAKQRAAMFMCWRTMPSSLTILFSWGVRSGRIFTYGRTSARQCLWRTGKCLIFG